MRRRCGPPFVRYLQTKEKHQVEWVTISDQSMLCATATNGSFSLANPSVPTPSTPRTLYIGRSDMRKGTATATGAAPHASLIAARNGRTATPTRRRS